jgi:uncharacterized cupin superfamily protein
MSAVRKIPAAAAPLESMPLEPEQIISGEPKASGLVLHEGEGDTGTGIWEVTPGSFSWDYETNQSMYVLAGRAEVEIEGGERLVLEPGDAVFIPAGTRAKWTVGETLRKVYTLYR